MARPSHATSLETAMVMANRRRTRTLLIGAAMTLAAHLAIGCSSGPEGASAGGESESPLAPNAPAPAFAEAGAPSACQGTVVEAERGSLHLVVAFDRSKSMNTAGKWAAATEGLSTFLEAPQNGVHASLALFPQKSSSCDGDFVTPAVPMTALPSPSFRAELAKTELLGGTPMRPALEGAAAYAETMQRAAGPSARVVIGLVTDGAPSKGTCANNTVAAVEAVAREALAGSGILTFAIGMDGAVASSLDLIAAAGGTSKALVIDPAGGAGRLTQAFDSIRHRFACEVALPASTADARFDRRPDHVNVLVGATDGTLSYSPGCADGEGWRYDDEAHPSRIVLCDAACERSKNESRMHVKVGCPTVRSPR